MQEPADQFKRRPLPELQNFVDTDTVQAFRANNVFIIGMSDEALLDFYYIAPTEIHYAFAKRRSEIALDPVIRIVMSGSLLFEFLEKCRAAAERLPDFARIMEEEEP